MIRPTNTSFFLSLIAAALITGGVACAEDKNVNEATLSEADIKLMEAQEAKQKSWAKDLTPTIKPLYDLGESDDQKKIKVYAWIDKESLTYRVGEAVTLSISPAEDAYITVLNVGSSGRVAVLYPNHFQKERKVRGRRTVRVPARRSKWEIKVGGPAGFDVIKVIASKKPLTLKEFEQLADADAENPVVTLDRSAEETAKDLSPQLKPASDKDEPLFGVKNIVIRVKDKS